jgi:hypothetical protein
MNKLKNLNNAVIGKLGKTVFMMFFVFYKLCASRPLPEYSCGKRNRLYPIQAASFVSIVLYLILTQFPLCKLFEIYTQGHGPLKEVQV